jgi:hypothetical protein
MSAKAVNVVRFYNGRGIAEHWKKIGDFSIFMILKRGEHHDYR